MKKFLVLYCAPAEGMAKWMQMPEADRKAEEAKMRAEWDTWTASHKGLQSVVAGAGKTKRVTSAGVTDVANDVMLYATAEGESAEAVAAAYVGHPHFGIPTGWIDIMPVNYLPGMEPKG